MPRTAAQVQAEIDLIQGAITKALTRLGESAIVAYQTDGRGASILRGTDLEVLFKRQDDLQRELDRANVGTRRGPRLFSVFPQ